MPEYSLNDRYSKAFREAALFGAGGSLSIMECLLCVASCVKAKVSCSVRVC